MKDTLNQILLLIIGTIFGIIIHATCQAHVQNYHISTTNPNQIEYVYIPYPQPVETEEDALPEYEIEEEGYLNLSFEEMDLLQQIAYSEARGEGVEGMALVMNVVLNRANKTGKSIHDVIYQQGQFYTAGMTPNVSDECKEALQLVIEGYDESQGALFFNKYGYRQGCEPLFQYGNHYFSR